MIVLYSVLGFLLLLLCCLLWPVSLRVTYTDELRVKARVLGVPVTLFPGREKPPKKEKPAKKPGKRRTKREEQREKWLDLSRMLKEDGVGATLRTLQELAAILWKAARRVLRAITVRHLWLRLEIGGEDAAQTAIRYGQVCAALYPTVEAIGELVRIRQKELEVTPQFPDGESSVQLDVRLWVTPLRVLWAGLCLVCGLALRSGKQKANTQTESKIKSNSNTQEVTSHG